MSFFTNLFRKIEYHFVYSRHVFEKEVLPIRFSDEKFKRLHINTIRKDFFSFSIKTKDDLFKYLFYILSLLLLVALPLMSLKVGISDKELQQQENAALLYQYYQNQETVNLPNYVQTHPHFVDFFCYCISKWLNISNVFALRHLAGAGIAWLILMVVGLFLMNLFSWRAAFLGILFLFISPHFLSQSFCNLSDISFVFFYILTIYQFYIFITELPIVKWKRLIIITLLILLANSVHIGGFILLYYFFIFVLLAFVFENSITQIFTREYWHNLFKLAIICCGVWVAVFLFDFLNPLHFLHFSHIRIGNSLVYATENQSVVDLLWKGEMVSSDSLGLPFLLKRYQLTIPLVILLGCISHFLFVRQIIKTINWWNEFMLFFALIYPLWSIAGSGCSLGDGWSTYLLLYPLLIMYAVAGFEGMLRKVEDRYTNFVIVSAIYLLSFLPLRHVIFNGNCLDVYYNELSGGMRNIYGKYPLDEFEQVNRTACQWMSSYLRHPENVRSDSLPMYQIVTNGNAGCDFYFRRDTEKMQLSHVTFPIGDSIAWDYSIFFVKQGDTDISFVNDSIYDIVKKFSIDNQDVAYIFTPHIDTLSTSLDSTETFNHSWVK